MNCYKFEFSENFARFRRFGRHQGTLQLQRLGKSARYLCTEFGQLVLRKFIEIVTIRYLVLRLNCTKFDFRWGSASSDPLAGYKGPTSKGEEGKGEG